MAGAKFFEGISSASTFLAALFIAIVAGGAGTMFIPNNESGEYPETSMLVWRPEKETTYFWGLNRVIQQVRYDNPDYVENGTGDDDEPQYLHDFKGWNYGSCTSEPNNFPEGGMSTDLCQICYDQGKIVAGTLTACAVIYAIMNFAIPLFIVFALPNTSAIKRQMLFMVMLVDIYWNEFEAKEGNPLTATSGVTNYMTMNYDSANARMWTIYQFVFPVIPGVLMLYSLIDFQPCIDKIKAEYDDSDSMWAGSCFGLLVTACVFIGISTVGKIGTWYYGTRAAKVNKKNMEMWILEKPNDNTASKTFNPAADVL
jgi:hypothetical protein